MRQILHLTLAALLSLSTSQVAAQKIEWTSSTQTAPWKTSGALRLRPAASEPAQLTVYPDRPQQRMDGFGGCFNELGWEALLRLPTPEREQVLQQLFGKQHAAFTWGRLPVAANDYSLSYYSYNDVAGDLAMRNFNIDRDRYILIPYIKEARRIAPDLQLWASPWSPPAWMKVNGHYSMGGQGRDQYATDMRAGRNILNNAMAFRMETDYLDAYALYLSKFVQAYAQEGLPIARLCTQNEIVYQPQWPACTWRPEDMGYFIGQHLGPKFKADKLSTEIWLGTVNTADPDYTRTVLRNPRATEYIKGLGYQWDAKKAVQTLHQEYPTYPMMQTESECGNGANDWKAAEYTWSLLNRYVSNGTGTYMYWNMVLDETGRSTWGWVQNALISINKTTRQVSYHPEFYLLKHLSHYVQPGAHRLETSGGPDHLAFANPDGSLVLVLVNTEAAARTLTVAIGDKRLALTVPAKSFNTLAWPAR